MCKKVIQSSVHRCGRNSYPKISENFPEKNGNAVTQVDVSILSVACSHGNVQQHKPTSVRMRDCIPIFFRII